MHLIRECNGVDVFKRFINAYKKHDPGIPHTLVLVLKGFDGYEIGSDYRKSLVDLEYKEIFVSDEGYDIGAYMEAYHAYRDNFDCFCFLNSYSEPLYENWLEILARHIRMSGVGIVGSTGSCQSLTSCCDYRAFTIARKFKPLAKLILRVILPIYRLRFVSLFPAYPNAHIRTNGFLLPTTILDRVNVPAIKNKMEAYRFESGRDSLTRQIENMGLRPVIVGANGKAYEIQDWPFSNIFRRSEQENLLIADNQTETYSRGDRSLKIRYSFYAWRENAYPDDSET